MIPGGGARVKGPDGVLQKIEISLDGGKEWKTTFDAVYRRVK